MVISTKGIWSMKNVVIRCLYKTLLLVLVLLLLAPGLMAADPSRRALILLNLPVVGTREEMRIFSSPLRKDFSAFASADSIPGRRATFSTWSRMS